MKRALLVFFLGLNLAALSGCGRGGVNVLKSFFGAGAKTSGGAAAKSAARVTGNGSGQGGNGKFFEKAGDIGTNFLPDFSGNGNKKGDKGRLPAIGTPVNPPRFQIRPSNGKD